VTKTKFERIEYHGLKFDCRPGTSDEKAVKEVVLRKGYARTRVGFVPGEGERWVDLGGNIGAFSVWAASLGATVDCYEPDPDSCEMIDHNIRLNGLEDMVTLHHKAVVGDDRKKATLHRNTARGNVWRNSIERPWRGGTDIEVSCISIDKIWKKNRYIKMDIEGSEMAILEGIGSEVVVKGLVFEWSFDVDPSLPRFRAVIERLEGLYSQVLNGASPEGDVWKPEWFPPCRTVWCLK
jgi:FkbM family methyltransferase